MQQQINLIPPLRLLITTKCNGNCYFCHKEGCTDSLGITDMPKELIWESIELVKELQLPYLSLTGGEPTLRSDLPDIINELSENYPEIKIKLTSNGFNLLNVGQKLKNNIEEVNLSITSFKNEINSKYQNVNPLHALDGILNFPSLVKRLNIIVTSDNMTEINSIIEYCATKLISIDLIFELKEYLKQDYEIQRFVFKLIKAIGQPKLVLDRVPTLSLSYGEKSILRIKHPFFSSLIKREICINCPHQSNCYERVCAVRVYPNSFLTPCLNQYLSSSKDSFIEKAKDIYFQISKIYPISNKILIKNVTAFFEQLGVL